MCNYIINYEYNDITIMFISYNFKSKLMKRKNFDTNKSFGLKK